jgi:hypothetical protein
MSDKLKAFFEKQSAEAKLAAVLMWDCTSHDGELHRIASEAYNSYKAEILGDSETLSAGANDSGSFDMALLLTKALQ